MVRRPLRLRRETLQRFVIDAERPEGNSFTATSTRFDANVVANANDIQLEPNRRVRLFFARHAGLLLRRSRSQDWFRRAPRSNTDRRSDAAIKSRHILKYGEELCGDVRRDGLAVLRAL